MSFCIYTCLTIKHCKYYVSTNKHILDRWNIYILICQSFWCWNARFGFHHLFKWKCYYYYHKLAFALLHINGLQSICSNGWLSGFYYLQRTTSKSRCNAIGIPFSCYWQYLLFSFSLLLRDFSLSSFCGFLLGEGRR